MDLSRIFLLFSGKRRGDPTNAKENTMKIGVIGHNYTHGADFVMDYPDGPGCYLFLLVKTPARLLLNGKKLHLEKNTILFFTPHAACRYEAENGVYTDDWFYCNMTPEEEIALRNEGMPFDTPVQTQNAAELSELIRKMAYEHYSAELMQGQQRTADLSADADLSDAGTVRYGRFHAELCPHEPLGTPAPL